MRAEKGRGRASTIGERPCAGKNPQRWPPPLEVNGHTLVKARFRRHMSQSEVNGYAPKKLGL